MHSDIDTDDAGYAANMNSQRQVQSGAVFPGLSTTEAREVLETVGPNSISENEPSSWQILVHHLWGVIPGMLEVALVIDLILGRFAEAAVIASLLGFSVVLSVRQERHGRQALALLRANLSAMARVRRDGAWQQIPATEVVPGDLIHVRAGDLVPADLVLGDGLVSLDQSQLTGESLPVETGPGVEAYAGSRVVRGEATGLVTATADRTHFGQTAQLVQLARAPQGLQEFIIGTAKYLFIIDALLIAVVIATAAIRGGSSSDTLLFALMLLVAAVPIALPAMFTTTAAVGASMLAKSGVLTTRLAAIEDAAAMDVLCIDKTGTITENRLSVEDVAPRTSVTPEELLRLAAFASDDATQDPIDLAILAAAESLGATDGTAPDRLRFEPFDPSTKRSEATVRFNGSEVRVVKGSPQTLAELTDTPWADVQDDVAGLSVSGARVLAVASGTGTVLQLAGFVALADPPRADSAPLIENLNHQGIRVVLVTGDGEATARAVATQVGIAGEVAPTGTLHQDGLDAATLEQFSVFAGVLPEDKFRLVQKLQEAGHIVGMTGDGVNDAPALRQANVGIAVFESADVAKASASLVLTEPGLGGILAAIKVSRSIYQRMQSMLLAMVSRKGSIPPFLVLPFLIWGVMPLTPLLIVLFMLLGDITTFGFAKDKVVPSRVPDQSAVKSIVVTGLGFASFFLAASVAVFWTARFGFDLTIGQTQTAVFLWLLFAGGQTILYLVRARGAFWSKPYPTPWLLWASAFNVAVGSVLALKGWLMDPISFPWVVSLLGASLLFLVIGNAFKLAANVLLIHPETAGPTRPKVA
jgi:H+-transporting ATPase